MADVIRECFDIVFCNPADLGYDLEPTSHLLNHLNVSASRKGSPTPNSRPMSHELSTKRAQVRTIVWLMTHPVGSVPGMSNQSNLVGM